MFNKHPKGLVAASLSNLGERFGFYTMMAILVLFLQAKFGLNGKEAGLIYSTFYFSIYILALVGGIIADKTRNYKGTILTGIILMGVGYLMLAIPSSTPVTNQMLFLIVTCVALLVIAFGNGLFKGNLQALVGQMYDNPQYANMRDSGFSLFYMFINIGAIFAPFAAVGVRNWWLSTFGYNYNADLPALCHGHLAGTLTPEAVETYNTLATKAMISGTPVSDMTAFANEYLNVFTTGFHYAFGVAILAMLVSLVIFLVNKNKFPDPSKKTASQADATVVEMSLQEVKQRMYALFAVFGIVIFFWFSFHQNGLTLTYFAKEYTDLNLFGLPISAELFQSLNPFFVVFLTPIIMAIFAAQRARGKEPSTPKKIAIGMGIAATAFLVMAVGSYLGNLPMHKDIIAMGTSPVKVTPVLLMITYLILTIAELYISPLGISFVSKVAPPKYQGIMQGGWLGATAIGNQLLVIGAVLYESIPIWMTWTVFVVACCISMFTMLFMLKWLEKVAK
ncbi:peptide MFS transporter [uncultured Bacteroides sp.]|uniref:peptide MFS transporter n=1 Tax=uncultured Bacteroides sp. TaxID=162156 RepID=UPI002630BA2F|nr:peptide MFS transporter [uncultured Bacteroides sp.]